MTTPSNNTPSAIIADAYFDAGILSEGDSPNSEQLTSGFRRLLDLINEEQTQGLKLWLNQDTAVTLTAGTSFYTFGPTGTVVMVKPLRVLEAYYMDTNSNRRPLTVLSWNEFLTLSQVTQVGAISSYFVNKQQTNLEVTFWPVPDTTAATGTAHLLFQYQVSNVTNLTDEMNFPLEWRTFLRWGLADQLATGQPQAIMDRCQQRAEMSREKLEGWDVEDASTRFTPSTQAQYFGGGSFR